MISQKRIFVFLFCFGFVQSAMADDFSDAIKDDYPLTAQAYVRGVELYDHTGDEAERDKIAQGIFTGISTWLFDRGWQLDKEIQRVMTPSELSESELRESPDSLIQKARRVFNHHMELANKVLKLWFSRRAHAPVEEAEDAFKKARNVWYEHVQAGMCLDQLREAFWKNSQLHSYRGAFEGFTYSLGIFMKTVPAYVTNGLELPSLISGGTDHGQLSPTFLVKMRDDKVSLFNRLWNQREKGIEYVGRKQYRRLVLAKKDREADAYLKARFLMKALDFWRVQQKEDVVYYAGTEQEKKPSEQDLVKKLQAQFSSHITGGRDKTQDVKGSTDFATLTHLAVQMAPLKTGLLRTVSERQRLGLLIQRAEGGGQRELALGLSGPYQKLQSSEDTLKKTLRDLQRDFDKRWFMTAMDIAVAPMVMPEIVQEAHERQAKELTSKGMPKPQALDEVASNAARGALSNLVDVEKSEMPEETKLLWQRRHEQVALMWWQHRLKAPQFTDTKNPHEHRLRQWENYELFLTFRDQVLMAKPASSMISWDQPWGTSERLFGRFKEVIVREEVPLDAKIVAQAVWMAHEGGESLQFETQFNMALEQGPRVHAILQKLHHAPEDVDVLRQSEREEESLRQLWDVTRPLPYTTQEPVVLSLTGNETAHWASSAQQIVLLYNALNPAMGPKVGASASEIPTMIVYQGEFKEDSPEAIPLQTLIKTAFAHWNTRPVAGGFVDSNPVLQQRKQWENWALFTRWISSTTFVLSKLEALFLEKGNEDPIAPQTFTDSLFTLDGEISSALKFKGAIEQARSLWKQTSTH